MSKELRRRRKLKGLSQEELAEKLGISRQSLSALEKGTSLPSLELLAKLEQFFQESWRALFPEISAHYPLQNNYKSMRPRDFWHRFFPRFFEEGWFPEEGWERLFAPEIRVDLVDKGKKLILEADLPGFSKKDVEIEVRSNAVKIKAQKKAEKKEERKDFIFHEATASVVSRVVPLPTEVDPQKAKAVMRHGKLRLVLPKVHPEEGGRLIKPS